eukprot:PhM_4_TR19128/c1_g2_i1/m.24014
MFTTYFIPSFVHLLNAVAHVMCVVCFWSLHFVSVGEVVCLLARTSLVLTKLSTHRFRRFSTIRDVVVAIDYILLVVCVAFFDPTSTRGCVIGSVFAFMRICVTMDAASRRSRLFKTLFGASGLILICLENSFITRVDAEKRPSLFCGIDLLFGATSIVSATATVVTLSLADSVVELTTRSPAQHSLSLMGVLPTPRAPLDQPCSSLPNSTTSTNSFDDLDPKSPTTASEDAPIIEFLSTTTTTATTSIATITNCCSDKVLFDVDLEHWRQGALVGTGAFGSVHMGMDDRDGRLFAVKKITFDLNDDELNRNLLALQNEITILKRLDHEHIVKYYSSARIGTSVNIFMEYVPGGSIKDVVNKFGALSETTVVKYTYQIVLGLEYLHRNQVLHGDIKGANILVGVDGTCKLADFGSAVVSSERIMAAKQTGTPLWMAPEVVRGEYLIGWASDIW